MKSILIATLAVASFGGAASAWNGKGHMMVAAVAWDQLTPAAKTKASELLKLNPAYRTWTKGVSAPAKAKIAFVRAATWPDDIRVLAHGGGYTDDGSRPPTGPTAAQNLGYTDKNLHRYWHFRDAGFSPDDTPVPPVEAVGAVSQIKSFQQALASDDTSDGVKSYDLVWIEHLVGDIHQPLHAVSRYTKATPKGDNGGNSVKVCLGAARCDAKHSGKLHGFWDGAFGDTKDPKVAIAAAQGIGEPAGDASQADPDVWAGESADLAKSKAYEPPIGGDTGPVTLNDAYRTDAEAVARERVSLAGRRLANLLNAALK